MKIHFLLFAAFIAACRAEDLIDSDPDTSIDKNSDSNGESRAYGSGLAGQREYPWMVGLYKKVITFSTGAIISKQWILSAGRNINEAKPDYIEVGNMLKTSFVTRYNVTKYVRHPNYNPDTQVNDIAAIMVDIPIEFNLFVQPIKLPSLDISVGQKLTMSGWNAYNLQVNPPDDKLQSIKTYLLNRAECKKYYNVPAGVICTSVKPAKEICFDESGGLLTDGDTLIGIATFLSESCESGYPQIFTDVRYFLPWICSTTGEC